MKIQQITDQKEVKKLWYTLMPLGHHPYTGLMSRGDDYYSRVLRNPSLVAFISRLDEKPDINFEYQKEWEDAINTGKTVWGNATIPQIIRKNIQNKSYPNTTLNLNKDYYNLAGIAVGCLWDNFSWTKEWIDLFPVDCPYRNKMPFSIDGKKIGYIHDFISLVGGRGIGKSLAEKLVQYLQSKVDIIETWSYNGAPGDASNKVMDKLGFKRGYNHPLFYWASEDESEIPKDKIFSATHRYKIIKE